VERVELRKFLSVSKAFTRESDDAPELPVRPRRSSSLPPGARNYLTAGGAQALREELNRLINLERPRLTAANDNDAKRQLQAVNARIEHLQQSLHSAVVVAPPAAPDDQVRFGATVTVRNQRGETSRYRLVGVDETDIDRDWVSWLSPIAKALLNARVGQQVRIKLPGGEEQLEIIGVAYE
jgi:transcription elongation factor GreB